MKVLRGHLKIIFKVIFVMSSRVFYWFYFVLPGEGRWKGKLWVYRVDAEGILWFSTSSSPNTHWVCMSVAPFYSEYPPELPVCARQCQILRSRCKNTLFFSHILPLNNMKNKHVPFRPASQPVFQDVISTRLHLLPLFTVDKWGSLIL